MIEGAVNAAYEAIVTLSVEGPTGQTRQIEAVVDTGYSGFLCLSATLVAELGLERTMGGQVVLANDAVVEFDVYRATVLWGGQRKAVAADALGSTSLVGMLLLEDHRLTVDVVRGGRVVIEANAQA